MNNAKFVTRRAKLRMMNTITSLGMTDRGHVACIMAHHLRLKEMKALKTTKFIESKPILTVSNGIIPF